MAIVKFDQASFLADYPEFAATVTAVPTSAQACFKRACFYLDNTDRSRVPDPPRTDLLNLLVAHCLQLFFGVNGEPPSGGVGRVASAGEGSVNATFDMGTTTPDQAWYNQTQYGASYWQAVAPYRTAFYVAPRTVEQFFVIPGD